MKSIIDEKKYKKLKRLLKGGEEDKNLVVQIIDQCDIKESFPYIIALVSQYHNEKYVFSSGLFKSQNLFHYVIKELSFPVSSKFTLDMLMEWIDRYSTIKKVPPKLKKLIIKDYETLSFEDSQLFEFKPKLKPKKNV